MSRTSKITEQPWSKSVEEILSDTGVDSERGLNSNEVTKRREKYGPNRLRESTSRPSWRILLDQLKSVVVILLMSASLAAALFERMIEALAIAAAIVVNTIIGFAMEFRATRAMEALQRISETTVRVRRDGEDKKIAADELVPGDIVLLEAGDMIAADLRLLEANSLQCDEAALTGESVAADKNIDVIADKDVALGDRSNMAYKGTAVTQGSGHGVVVATAMQTEIGHISQLVEEAEQSITPLEKRLNALGHRLVWLTLGIAVIVAGSGYVAGKDLVVMLETAIALAIAAVPEGLPVVATLALAQGMRRMARRNAVVKRLSAVETLGAANLIFTDKTGTLTENHMTLARLALDRGTLKLEDDSGFSLDGESLKPDDAAELRAALEIGALCNNASFEDDSVVGDPTEVAFLEAAVGVDIARRALLDEQPEVREESFDTAVKMMATFHEREGHYRVAVKGAPEAVIDCCTQVLTADGEQPLDDEARQRWHERSDKLAGEGLRMLVLAQKTVDDQQADPYKNLTLVALAGLYDPPRKGISETVSTCQKAGIRIVMGTGDHPATAAAIAAEIGLKHSDRPPVVASELKDLKNISDEERRELLENSVFSRISPEQKLDLISLFQKSGHVVGMTGDGVNDAPGLKKADIGIAMGQRGTEVAREAADIVLKDDNFATIVVAIEHGRTIFNNIRRFIVYLLSGNLGEIMAISAAALVAAPLPMLPLQILYINFVSDVMPALALGLNRSEKRVMQQLPRETGESILLSRHWVAIGGYAALIAAAVLGVFALALLWLEMSASEAVTLSFLTFGFARLWHVFNMRNSTSPMFVNEVSTNHYVWISIVVGILLLLAAAYIPLLARVLSVHAPDTTGWLMIISFSLLPLIVVQLMKLMGIGWEAAEYADKQ